MEIDTVTMKDITEIPYLGVKLSYDPVVPLLGIFPMKTIIQNTQWKQWKTLFLRTPKSLQMVTAAMKLKDTRSLEEKL